MKRHGYLFEKLIDRENLELALHNACKGKSHYRIVERIKEKPQEYIDALYEILLEEKYEPAEIILKYIHDKGKLRELKKTAFFPDRVIHHAIVQVINPILMKHFIYHTYQSIEGKGVHKAVLYASKCLRRPNTNYALMIDIIKFYPSVNNDKLMESFRRIIKDKRFLNLLSQVVYHTEGLPIGFFTSQPLGNFSISDIDHYAKEELGLKSYIRYADDILIFHESKEYLHEVRKKLAEKLAEKGLKVKDNYQVFDVRTRHPDFLGYVLFPNGKARKIRKSTKRRFIRLVKRNNWTVSSVQALISYMGWLSYANTKHLVSRYFTDEVKEALLLFNSCKPLPNIILKELE